MKANRLEDELVDASRREKGLQEELEDMERERSAKVDRLLKLAEAKQDAEIKAKAVLEKVYEGFNSSLKDLREGMRQYEALSAILASAQIQNSDSPTKRMLFGASDEKTKDGINPKLAAATADGLLDPSELPRSTSLIKPGLKKNEANFLRDLERLGKGTLMTKIPRWGKHKKAVFCLKKIKSKDFKAIDDAKSPGKPRDSSISRSPTTPAASTPAASTPTVSTPASPLGPTSPKESPALAGDKGEEWVYCLEWLSKGQKARLALTGDLVVQFGQTVGQFNRAVNKKQYAEQAKMSFSIICPDRTIDMVSEKMEDFQCWQTVLRYLLTERVES